MCYKMVQMIDTTSCQKQCDEYSHKIISIKPLHFSIPREITLYSQVPDHPSTVYWYYKRLKCTSDIKQYNVLVLYNSVVYWYYTIYCHRTKTMKPV